MGAQVQVRVIGWLPKWVEGFQGPDVGGQMCHVVCDLASHPALIVCVCVCVERIMIIQTRL